MNKPPISFFIVVHLAANRIILRRRPNRRDRTLRFGSLRCSDMSAIGAGADITNWSHQVRFRTQSGPRSGSQVALHQKELTARSIGCLKVFALPAQSRATYIL